MSLLADAAPLLESHGLSFHARGRDSSELQITREGSPVTEADRQHVIAWADGWSDRAQITVSGIFDLSEQR